jgi:hypothetical protein
VVSYLKADNVGKDGLQGTVANSPLVTRLPTVIGCGAGRIESASN